MPNRSLDDFAGGDDGAADEPTAVDGAADEPTAVDGADDSPDAGDTNASDADDRDVSTLATYRWTPEPAACPQCGESVQKRWLDGDEYVCLDCKDW
ncbi:hypothetical protein E4P24_09730 [Haloferax sp. AS1]|uniref:zinc ribbon domain-containing protein n=1 Tax=Haloferax sp. AS1 TaxID=2562277 RepID=UPI00165EC020|nr:zinc ribbon domain-containing protein [Haloferax sp. AS1]MBC9986645.1 hypothetical protein [Haloferax sp. AS1]